MKFLSHYQIKINSELKSNREARNIRLSVRNFLFLQCTLVTILDPDVYGGLSGYI